MSHDKQGELPFAAAEGNHAERRALLGAALAAVGCNLATRCLCEWVFNVTSGGGTLQRTAAQLAERPWGLCCSASKARAVVRKAREAGLLLVVEERYTTGGQRANTLQIDWEGVARLTRGAGVRNCSPGVRFRHPPSKSRQGVCKSRYPYKEYPSLDSLFQTSGPGPEAPGPDREVGGKQQATPGVVAQVPELREAADRSVAPLEAGKLAYGAFKPLRLGHLDRPRALVRWHRCQLGLDRPVVTGATEADVLLVLAAAIHAMTMPPADVKKNRVAVFVRIVSRGKWWDCLDRVPEARRRLDELLQRFGPELLSGPWPAARVAGERSQGT